jgi:hypothetical protein
VKLKYVKAKQGIVPNEEEIQISEEENEQPVPGIPEVFPQVQDDLEDVAVVEPVVEQQFQLQTPVDPAAAVIEPASVAIADRASPVRSTIPILQQAEDLASPSPLKPTQSPLEAIMAQQERGALWNLANAAKKFIDKHPTNTSLPKSTKAVAVVDLEILANETYTPGHRLQVVKLVTAAYGPNQDASAKEASVALWMKQNVAYLRKKP